METETLFSFWMIMDYVIHFIGLCASTYLVYLVLGHFFRVFRETLEKRNVQFHPQKQKVCFDILRVYLTSTFFMVVLMHPLDPAKVERYYTYPNLYCMMWGFFCFSLLENTYSKDWEFTGVLKKPRRIDNYILWVVLYGLFLFLIWDYLFKPTTYSIALPYYVVLPFIAVMTTWVIMIWRNIGRSDLADDTVVEKKELEL